MSASTFVWISVRNLTERYRILVQQQKYFFTYNVSGLTAFNKEKLKIYSIREKDVSVLRSLNADLNDVNLYVNTICIYLASWTLLVYTAHVLPRSDVTLNKQFIS